MRIKVYGLSTFSGHVSVEGRRPDAYQGKTVKSFTSDYQTSALEGGGCGLLMKPRQN